MCDAILQSTKQSSLARTLMSEKIEPNYEVKVLPSLPKAAHEIVTVPFNNGSNVNLAGGTMKVSIPKLGNCKAAWIRYRITGLVNGCVSRVDGTSVNTRDRLFASPNPGVSLTQSVALSTHSRVISSITSHGILSMIEEMPSNTRELYKALCGCGIASSLDGADKGVIKRFNDAYGLTTGLTKTAGVIELFVPVHLSSFSGPGLWAGFLENIDIELVMNPATRAFCATGTHAGGGNAFNGVSRGPSVHTESQAGVSITADLQMQVCVMDDLVYRKAIDQVYRNRASVQSLGYKWELVGTLTKSYDAAGETDLYVPLDFTINCSSSVLARSLHVFVYKDDDQSPSNITDTDIKAMSLVGIGPTNCERITEVTCSASGRTLFKTSPEMELMATAGDGEFSAGVDATASHFVHRFAMKSDANRYSGGAAFSGLSSQSFTVKALAARTTPYHGVGSTAAYDAKYTCAIYAGAYLVTSTNSSSGAYRTSLSV